MKLFSSRMFYVHYMTQPHKMVLPWIAKPSPFCRTVSGKLRQRDESLHRIYIS